MTKTYRALCIIIAIILLCTTAISVTASSYDLPFSDVGKNRWSHQYIGRLYTAGIISGKSADRFAPTDDVTRAEFVKILGGVVGIDHKQYKTAQFVDVSDKAWYYGFVAWAVQKGVTKGTSEDRFSPDENIIRQDMATMIYRFVKAKGISLSTNHKPIDFQDADQIADYASRAVRAMQSAGIINGIKTAEGYKFFPCDNATREESVKMLCVLYEIIKSEEQDSSASDQQPVSPKPQQPIQLLQQNKSYNHFAKTQYDIDQSGFAKASLSDLKGKTLTIFTGRDLPMFTYYDKDQKAVNEWIWFQELAEAYGVTVKAERVNINIATAKAYQAQAGGKSIDLITTTSNSFPYINNILEPLDEHFDFSKIQNSPGVNPLFSEVLRWKGARIAIGPKLSSKGLNYNSTFVRQAGLPDPYTQWQNGEWNWKNFKQYMVHLPDTTAEGKPVYGCSSWGNYWFWAAGSGKTCFELDGNDPNGGIINNLDTHNVVMAYIWLESVMDAGGQYYNRDGNELFFDTSDEGYVVMNFDLPGIDRYTLAPKNVSNEYRWVPLPHHEKEEGLSNYVDLSGFGIALARKTNNSNDRKVAAKFAELWCTRFSEARFDFLKHRALWSYDQIKEYHDFSQEHSVMGLGAGVGELGTYVGGLNVQDGSAFNIAIIHPSYSTATAIDALAKHAQTEIDKVATLSVTDS